MVVEAFAWPGVEFVCDDVALVLRDLGHAETLGQVLANKSVGVFVCSAFPRVMRCGEIEENAGSALNLRVAMKFRAIVGGDGLESGRLAIDQVDGALRGLRGGSRIELADLQKAGFAIDQADDAVFAGVTDNGIDFPMSDAGTLLGSERSV